LEKKKTRQAKPSFGRKRQEGMEGGKEAVSERGSERIRKNKPVMFGPGDVYGPSRCFCNRGSRPAPAADVILTGPFQPL